MPLPAPGGAGGGVGGLLHHPEQRQMLLILVLQRAPIYSMRLSRRFVQDLTRQFCCGGGEGGGGRVEIHDKS